MFGGIKPWFLLVAVLVAVQGNVQGDKVTKSKQPCDQCSCVPGIPGTNGMPGLSGPAGIPGKSGQKGSKGAIGNDGARGFSEVRFKGDPGPKGMKGAVGATGLPGMTGLEGSRGNHGIPGSQGYDGSKGEVGFMGMKGDPGMPGIDGSKGECGRDGSLGIKGEPGPAGPAGPSTNTNYNWKQCVWNREDRISSSGTDDHVQECKIVKKSRSALKVSFQGNLGGTTCKRWYFKFNGQECQIPGPIEAIIQPAHNNQPKTNHYFIQGFCDSLPAGLTKVGLHVRDCPGESGQSVAYSGGKSYRSAIMIEELPSR